MADLTVDIRDIQFSLFDQIGVENLFSLPLFAELDKDTVIAVLEEAYKLAKNQMAPMNSLADTDGCTFDPKTGAVKVPKAFHDTYKTFSENGWVGLSHSPEWGGQGMPYVLDLAARDCFFAGCLSFCLLSLLTSGAAHLVEVFGSDELKKLYLEKMYTGLWAGTMCLTESAAGSDVGAVRTKAKRAGDRYLIEGEKIFITFGDHDLTENICHAVLARLEDAPAGTRGISLFLVPKIKVNPDGSLGEPNDVKCAGLEHKMGIHASPTCTLVFGDEGQCEGYLLGEENKGMGAMFQMMNEARITVGMQAVSLANAGYQHSLAFAKERVQGKDIATGKEGSIMHHPDIKRMLLVQKAFAEGARGLLHRTAYFADLAAASESDDDKQKYHGLVELLTPICKAYGSDVAFKATVEAMQTMGGYGYLKEYPIEQYLRDTKIASIYEGTNGIQALDLVARKLPARGGEDARNFVGMLSAFTQEHSGHPVLGNEIQTLARAVQALVEVSMFFAKQGAEDRMVPVVNAAPFLEMMGHIAIGWILLEKAAIAHPRLAEICTTKGVAMDDPAAVAKLCEDDESALFFQGKIAVAQFFARRQLALCGQMGKVLMAGDRSPLEACL